MKIIAIIGEDVKQQDGKFRFIIYENIVPFFVFLHNLVESLIDLRNLALEKGNILTSCLEKLSKSKELRDKWNGITRGGSRPVQTMLMHRSENCESSNINMSRPIAETTK